MLETERRHSRPGGSPAIGNPGGDARPSPLRNTLVSVMRDAIGRTSTVARCEKGFRPLESPD